jgi:hypothetical protein
MKTFIRNPNINFLLFFKMFIASIHSLEASSLPLVQELEDPKPRKDIQLVMDIEKRVCLKLKKEKNLHCFGTTASMMYEIKTLGLSFIYYDQIDIPQARNLIISGINEYLDGINSNLELRPYLDHWPFTANDIEFDISILKPNGSRVDPESLNFVSCEKNSVSYYPRQDHIKTMPPPLLTETYQQALQLLEEDKKQTSTHSLTKTSADQISREKPA